MTVTQVAPVFLGAPKAIRLVPTHRFLCMMIIIDILNLDLARTLGSILFSW